VLESPNDCLDEARMIGVEQAIERLAVPQDANVEPGTERSRDSAQLSEWDRIELPQLDPRNLALGTTRLVGDIQLAPTSSTTERP
jgi:hypothetical protein